MLELLLLHFMIHNYSSTYSVWEELVLESSVLQKVLNTVVANAATSEMTAQSNLDRWHLVPIVCLIQNIVVFKEIYKALQYFYQNFQVKKFCCHGFFV